MDTLTPINEQPHTSLPPSLFPQRHRRGTGLVTAFESPNTWYVKIILWVATWLGSNHFMFVHVSFMGVIASLF